jgi:prolipoprotein diacylglyceryltransferase
MEGIHHHHVRSHLLHTYGTSIRIAITSRSFLFRYHFERDCKHGLYTVHCTTPRGIHRAATPGKVSTGRIVYLYQNATDNTKNPKKPHQIMYVRGEYLLCIKNVTG